MGNKGWIRAYRSLLEHWLWKEKPFSKGQAWIDLIMMANHKTMKFPFGNEVVLLKAGDLITSEVKLMERWGWSKSKLRTFLKLLESDGMICKKTDRKKTTITIVKYRDFQEIKTNNRPITDQSQTNRRPIKDTNNNDNNDNNVKNVKKYNTRTREGNYPNGYAGVKNLADD